MTDLPPFDGCEVLRELRSGPATTWYLARQTAVGRTVVVKTLNANVLPESPFAAPLEREARLLGRMQHRGVVQLYEFVKSDRRMWVVREYVDGCPLDELHAAERPLKPAAAVAIACQVGEALEYVHSLGIVHRDVQPRNILVARRGIVKLSNFFHATSEQSAALPELVEGNSGFAEPSYMSPEQVLGEMPDPRSDLFSLGVVLYEMLSGVRPFDGPDSRSTAQRIRHEPTPPLPKSLGCPPALERLVLRALQKVPADRFANAKEMSLALRHCLSALAPTAESPEAVLAEDGSVGTHAEHAALVSPLPDSRTGLGWHSVAYYAAAFAALAVGVGLIESFASSPERTRPAKQSELALRPASGGFFRAVARPWAHVYVDGQLVETTPFSAPIPLSDGLHHVRFEHPRAEPVKRQVQIIAGQVVFLDVDMPLSVPISQPSPEAPLPLSPDAGPASP